MQKLEFFVGDLFRFEVKKFRKISETFSLNAYYFLHFRYVQQRVGFAFFLQMGACFFHFVAFLISILATYFAFTVKGGALDRYSIQNSSKTNVTNIGR